ncbi:unnamed protein product [Protopolystoma xenopodis]|uniref:Uncharacterized protein n=1 Tax=Protopolystoma xenopodis TaxID=117903 RepID=A0A448WI90_9PLAT|nr:unnamed protein product [Protopolystoma xenopodis]
MRSSELNCSSCLQDPVCPKVVSTNPSSRKASDTQKNWRLVFRQSQTVHQTKVQISEQRIYFHLDHLYSYHNHLHRHTLSVGSGPHNPSLAGLCEGYMVIPVERNPCSTCLKVSSDGRFTNIFCSRLSDLQLVRLPRFDEVSYFRLDKRHVGMFADKPVSVCSTQIHSSLSLLLHQPLLLLLLLSLSLSLSFSPSLRLFLSCSLSLPVLLSLFSH